MKITICNFRCFRSPESVFEFQNEKLVLLKGHSGVGKSTVLEAIRWCLFGNLRNIYPSGFTPTQGGGLSNTKTYVKIHLNEFSIIRSQAPEQLKVLLKDSELTQEPAQSYIESVFGNKTIWAATSLIRQGEKCPLMTSTNAERMTLLNEILFGNDISSEFENPDYYIERIEKELEVIDLNITSKTAVFNSNYTKYVDAIKSFTNPYSWSTMTPEMIQEIDISIISFRTMISDLSNRLIHISELMAKKKLLAERLLTFDLNQIETCNETRVNEVNQEYTNCQSNLSSLKQQLQSAIVKQTRFESLQKDLESVQNSLASLSSVPLHETSEQLNSKIQNLRTLLIQVQNTEVQNEQMKRQLTSVEESKEAVEKYLQNCKNRNVQELEKILKNSQIYNRLHILTEKIQSLNSTTQFLTQDETQIPILREKYTKELHEIKFINRVCQKYNIQATEISSKVQESKESLENYEIQKQNYTKYQQCCTLEKTKQDLQSRLIIIDGVCMSENYIQEQIQSIENRLGSPLCCPKCSCTLELKNNTLVIPESDIISKEEGNKQINRWKQLSKDCKHNELIQNEILSIEAKLSLIEYDRDMLHQSMLTESQKVQLTMLIQECSTIQTVPKNTMENIELQLSNLTKTEDYLNLVKEYNKLIPEFSNSIGVEKDIVTLEESIIQIPLHETKLLKLEDEKNKIQSKLIEGISLCTRPSSDIQEEISNSNRNYENVLQVENLKSKSENLIQEIRNIDIQNVTALQELIQNTELELSTITEHKNSMEQNFRLLKEYHTLKNQHDQIILSEEDITIDQILRSKQTEYENLLEQKSQAQLMLTLLSSQSELQNLRNELVDLTNKKTSLNSLKNLIVDVTNSTLQDLVDNINNTTNSILEDLFDNSLVIELKLYKELKNGKGKVKPQVNMGFYHNGHYFDNVSVLSGGEASRVSLALTMALAVIHPTPFLAVDEIMSSLNQDSREACIESIRKYLIESNPRCIINVEHMAIEGLYDEVITLGCC
jgi:DNA repair exonuclease SbcCD ATPase subunit